MPRFHTQSSLPVSAGALYAYHAAEGAFERLVPPWERITTVHAEGGIGDGAVRIMRLRKGPLALRWEAHHQDHVPGAAFTDVAVRGPFRSWRHEHVFLPENEGSTLSDTVTYALPAPLAWLPEALVRRQLTRLFAYRHLRTHADLVRQQPFAYASPLRIIFCGRMSPWIRRMAAFLATAGHRCYRLCRRPGRAERFLMEDCFSGESDHVLDAADALIYTGLPPHAAPAADPAAFWTFLQRACATLGRPPRLLLNLHVQDDPAARYTADPALDGGMRRELRREHARTAEAQESLEDLVDRRVDLYLPLVIGAPFSALIGRLMHLETRLFATEPTPPSFPWVAEDDVAAALLHVVLADHLQGDLTVAAPEHADRAALQRALLGRGFWAYSGHRMLRVLPGRTTNPRGMFTVPDTCMPLALTGFHTHTHGLEEALDLALGPRMPAS